MLRNIQALRGLAAMLVVFVHLQQLAHLGGAPADVFVWGNSGVDLFFVISGLIMVHTTRRGTGPLTFLRHRLTRVAPFYWLVTLGVFALALAVPRVLQSTQADPAQLLKSLAFIPYVRADGLTHPIVFLGWTLNYEMAFYLLFALGLAWPRRAWGAILVIAAIVAVAALGPILAPADPIARFYTAPIILEFAAGVGLGLLTPRLPAGRPIALAAIPVAGAAFALMMVAPAIWPAADRSLIFGLPATVIVACAVIAERGGVVARQRWAQVLGDASYSIYLTHFFVTAFITAAAVKLGLTHPIVLAALGLATVAAVAAVGIVTHHAIELPLTAWARDAVEAAARRAQAARVRHAAARS